MRNKPEHYSTRPAAQLSDQELAETWHWIAKRHDLGDAPEEPMEVVRQTNRVNELEEELMTRDFQPAEDDDGLLFGVENADGERLV